MEKYSKKLVVLIFTLIFLVLGLGTYIFVDKFVLTEDTCVCDCDSNSVLKDKNKTFIYDNPNYKFLKIPYININTIDAEKINKEIENFYIEELELTDKSMNEDIILDYDYYNNGGTLSIISYYNNNSVDKYNVANINIKSGENVDNVNLLSQGNIDVDKINEIMIEIFKNSIDTEKDKLYKETKVKNTEKNIYDSNIELIKGNDLDSLKMYLNDNGELCVIVEEYQSAGPETNEKIMNLSKKKYEKIYEKTE